MPSLMETIAESISHQHVETMSSQLDANTDQIKTAIGAALPLLVGALARKGAEQQQSASVWDLLDQNSDGSVLDDIGGFLSGKKYEQHQQGASLLKSVLGDKTSRVEQGVSKTSGLSQDTVVKLLKMLAPLVLAALVKQKASGAVNRETLPDVLRREQSQMQQHHPGLLDKVLDQDNDGDFDLSDMAKVAMNNIFGK